MLLGIGAYRNLSLLHAFVSCLLNIARQKEIEPGTERLTERRDIAGQKI